MTAPALARGFRFTHLSYLASGWTPGPGQRYADAPKALCEVTYVTAGRVVFQEVGFPGTSYLHHATFAARYLTADELLDHLDIVHGIDPNTVEVGDEASRHDQEHSPAG